MGATKSEIVIDGQNRMADLTNAFAHPAWVAILQTPTPNRGL